MAMALGNDLLSLSQSYNLREECIRRVTRVMTRLPGTPARLVSLLCVGALAYERRAGSGVLFPSDDHPPPDSPPPARQPPRQPPARPPPPSQPKVPPTSDGDGVVESVLKALDAERSATESARRVANGMLDDALSTRPKVGGTGDIPLNMTSAEVEMEMAKAAAQKKIMEEGRHDVLEREPRQTFGQSGRKGGRLSGPTHAVVLRNEQIVVSDSDNHRLVIYSKDGQLMRTIGKRGAGTGRFDYPRGLALHRDGDAVYVVECGNNRVQKVSIRTGESLGKSSTRFTKDTHPKFMKCPEAAAYAHGSVFVSDAHHNRIIVLDEALQLKFTFGTEGRHEGQFAFPRGVAANGNEVFVTDTFNRRVQVFTHEGVYVRRIEYELSSLGVFDQPHGLALGHGYLYIADFMGSALHVFDVVSGHPLQRLDMPGRITGVCAGSEPGHALYAVDNQHNRIHALALKGAGASYEGELEEEVLEEQDEDGSPNDSSSKSEL